MFDVTVTDKKNGGTKVVKVPNAIGDAVVVGGLSAVLGVTAGLIRGAVRDIKDIIKAKKNK